ncbi:MAG: 2-amino-4-hydroxy-6-hydroxymethyldihydropteridine diphosphokinase [Rhizobiales bacterium]|nr:2-amino-4-hydroxy-6-hydroxymethyldihydropteridine diphosphokinase [Hyphomicrobiales bacterium]
MILVALGANMAGPWGTPRQAVTHALRCMNGNGLRLVAASDLVETGPFGRLNQPDFINAVAAIETHLPPQALLARLHAIERAAGRRRTMRWGPRTLDLDLLDYRGLILRGRQHATARGKLILPHPGIAARRFVLEPLSAIAPSWRHPLLHATARELLQRLRFGKGRVSNKRTRKRARP